MIYSCPKCGASYEREVKDKIAESCDNCDFKFEVTSNGRVEPLVLGEVATYTSDELARRERCSPGRMPGQI